MSAIIKTCRFCGAQYTAGMVGSTPWPGHECANDEHEFERARAAGELLTATSFEDLQRQLGQ